MGNIHCQMYVYRMEGIVYISIYYTFKGFFVYIYMRLRSTMLVLHNNYVYTQFRVATLTTCH